MGYYILHPPDSSSRDAFHSYEKEAAQLRGQLENGSTQERREALRRLIALKAEKTLSDCLAAGDPEVAPLAIAGLWECWMNEAGADARHQLEEGVESMNGGDLEAASEAFTRLMAEYPGWPEAINKEATVLYLQGKLRESIELCHRVIALKPDHFGAWNGLAICAIQTENWPLALRAVQESLRLQPRSQTNRQLLRLVESRLPQV